MGLDMCGYTALGWIYTTHWQLMGVMVDGRVLGGMTAWIGYGRIGIRSMRLELGVFGRIGRGGGANVGIVGEVGTDRTIAGALPAVVSNRSSRRDAEWRKFTRSLGICGDGS